MKEGVNYIGERCVGEGWGGKERECVIKQAEACYILLTAFHARSIYVTHNALRLSAQTGKSHAGSALHTLTGK